MRLFDRLASYLVARASRTPYSNLVGYMNRNWLVPYAKVDARQDRDGITRAHGTGPVTWRRPIAKILQRFDIAVRVHEILRSDLGRDPHDHPWSYITVILRGGYEEHRYAADGSWLGAYWCGPGTVLFRPAKSLHKLVVPTGQVCTTLFVTRRYEQKWGFLTPDGKVPHDQYRKGAQ